MNNIKKNHEKHNKEQDNIKEIRDLFEGLDTSARNSLENVIKFLLFDQGKDAEITYNKDPEIKNMLEKIYWILCWLWEKNYLHMCKLILEKIDTKNTVEEILSTVPLVENEHSDEK